MPLARPAEESSLADPARDPHTVELFERWKAAERALAGAENHAIATERAVAKAERAAVNAERAADAALRTLGVAHGRFRDHVDGLERGRR
jgi:hypothetical protein